jgi:peroxiredoxin
MWWQSGVSVPAQIPAVDLSGALGAGRRSIEETMTEIYAAGVVLNWAVVGVGCWIGWQLLRQNGRILLRLEELEKRLDDLEFGGNSEIQDSKADIDKSLVTSAATGNGEDHSGRFANRSLVKSKITRDGLKAGTSAPHFRLPRVDGHDELSLEEMRGRGLLLVFSDPHCGPCQALAPQVEKFHRGQKNISVVMISRGEPKENRAKVKEHGLTFPVLLQQRWEISRLYAMFVTPMAYLIDEQGVIMKDVAAGVEPVLELMDEAKKAIHPEAPAVLA